MSRRLSKEESRQRYAEGRKLWNAFDPIGVVADGDGVDDEYDSYVGPCLRIVEANQGVPELSGYVSKIVFEYMGMSESAPLKEAIGKFSSDFTEWYLSKWADTVS